MDGPDMELPAQADPEATGTDVEFALDALESRLSNGTGAGLTDDEVAALRDHYRVPRLPASWEAFLRRLGRADGIGFDLVTLWLKIDDDHVEYNAALEAEEPGFPRGGILVADHDGYIWSYYRREDVLAMDEPPLYVVMAGEVEPREYRPTFRDLLCSGEVRWTNPPQP